MEENKALQIFSYEGNEVRTSTDEYGESWWVAADVCAILEHSDVSKAVSRLDEDEKGTTIVRTLGGNQEMLCVNESGIYHLIFTSRKEEAKKFRRWVTHEVLPAIRKTGSYSANRVRRLAAPGQQYISKVTKETIEILHQSSDPVSPKELAARLQKPGGTIRKRLFDMKHRGEVERTDDGYISLLSQDEM